MFNWSLFIILVLLAVPGIVVTLPQLIGMLDTLIANQVGPNQKRPSRTTLLIIAIMQYLFLAAGATALGVWLAPKVGLTASFFSALADRVWSWPVLIVQLKPAVLLGSGGALIFVIAYYSFFRPRFDPQTRQASEKMRYDMGLAARLLYGGIYEEILARWGLMTLIAWLGLLLTGSSTGIVMWSAIIIAGIIFGLFHVPNYVATGSRPTPFFIAYMIVMNGWASIVFGYLFWQYGLLAAMVAHMLFHLWWWPFDRLVYQPTAVTTHHQLPQLN